MPTINAPAAVANERDKVLRASTERAEYNTSITLGSYTSILPASSTGVPDALVGANNTLVIRLNGVVDTPNWSVTVVTVGCTVTVLNGAITFVGFLPEYAPDTAYYTINATRAVYGTLSTNCSVSRVRRGGISLVPRATINSDPELNDSSISWALQAGVTVEAPNGAPGGDNFKFLACSTTQKTVFATEFLPIQADRVYNFTAKLFGDFGNDRRMFLVVDMFDAAGVHVHSNTAVPLWGGTYTGYVFGTTPPTPGSWTVCGGDFGFGVTARPIPPTAAKCKLGVIFQYSNTGTSAVLQGAQNLRLVDVTEERANQALAQAALDQLTDLAKDSVLSLVERGIVELNYDTILADRADLESKALIYGVNLDPITTTYTGYVNTLSSYISGLPGWNNIPKVAITGIDAATFKNNFVNVKTSQQKLVNLLVTEAGKRAEWNNIPSGPGTNKPENNATVGANATNFTGKIGGGNLIQNSSFETLVPNSIRPAGWALYSSISASLTTTTGRNGTGSKAAWIIASTGGVGATLGISPTLDTNVSDARLRGGWVPSSTYVLSFYAKKLLGTSLTNMRLLWTTLPSAVVEVVNPNLSSTWQRYVFRVTWGASVNTSGIYNISCSGTVSIGDQIFIDDVQVEEGDVVTSYKESALDSISMARPLTIDTIGNYVTPRAIRAAYIEDESLDSTKFANTITVPSLQTADPTVGNFTGRLIYRTDINKLRRYNGVSWEHATPTEDLAGTLTTDQIGVNSVRRGNILDNEVVFGKVAAGAIGVDQLKANAVTTSKMAVAANSMIANPDFATGDFTNWRPYTLPTVVNQTVVLSSEHSATGAPSKYVAKYMGTNANVSTFAAEKAYSDVGAAEDGFAVTEGSEYLATISVTRTQVTNFTSLTLYAFFYTKEGRYNLSRVVLSVPLASVPATQWTTLRGTFSPIFGATRCWLYVTCSGLTGTLYWGGVTCRQKAGGELIVDGTITTQKLSANSIDANVVLVDGSITAEKLGVGSITTSKILVTSEASSIWPDSSYHDPAVWRADLSIDWGRNMTQGIISDGISGDKCFYVTNSGGAVRGNMRVPVTVGKRYKISIMVRSGAGTNGYFFLRLDTGTVAPTFAAYNQVTIGLEAITVTPGGWTPYGVEWIATAPYVSPVLLLNYQGTAGWMQAQDLRIQEKTDGSLIVDGTITTKNLEIGSVTSLSQAAYEGITELYGPTLDSVDRSILVHSFSRTNGDVIVTFPFIRCVPGVLPFVNTSGVHMRVFITASAVAYQNSDFSGAGLTINPYQCKDTRDLILLPGQTSVWLETSITFIASRLLSPTYKYVRVYFGATIYCYWNDTRLPASVLSALTLDAGVQVLETKV